VCAARIAEYDRRRQLAFEAFRHHEEKAPGAELAAQTVLKIIASKAPRLRYLIGSQAKVAARLQRFLPEATYEWGKRSIFWLDR